MTVELKNRHWLLFFVLAGIQFGGLWIALTRSTGAPAVVCFFMRGASFGLVIPISFVIASSFTTTVILAKLIEVFTQQK